MEPSDPAWIKCFHMYFFVWFLLLFFTFLGHDICNSNEGKARMFHKSLSWGMVPHFLPGMRFWHPCYSEEDTHTSKSSSVAPAASSEVPPWVAVEDKY